MVTDLRNARDFDGETYDVGRDGKRLGRQLQAVFDVMKDGEWRSLRMISEATGAPEGSASARLRDLKKKKFGAHDIEKDWSAYFNGWLYRYVAPPRATATQGELFCERVVRHAHKGGRDG